jgi:hypothetical protein
MTKPASPAGLASVARGRIELPTRGWLVDLPEPVCMSQVFERYEREYLARLRAASQRRTTGILTQARTWFCEGTVRDPQVASVRPADQAGHFEIWRDVGTQGFVLAAGSPTFGM